MEKRLREFIVRKMSVKICSLYLPYYHYLWSTKRMKSTLEQNIIKASSPRYSGIYIVKN